MSFEPIKTKEEKAKEPKSPPWRVAWDSRRGPARSYKERPYRGKAERKLWKKERRQERLNNLPAVPVLAESASASEIARGITASSEARESTHSQEPLGISDSRGGGQFI